MNKQRGGTLLGFVLGLLVGLGVALAVAVYITKVPIPFVSKVQSGGADQETEAKKNQDWNPNAGLSGRPGAKPGDAAPGAVPGEPSAAGAPALPAEPPPAVAPAVPAAPAVAPTPGPQSSGGGLDLLGELAKARSEASKPLATPAANPSADPFNYFVQAGAYRTPEDAEQQRAKLSLMGVQARVTERDQAGRVVYRVRMGPYDKKDEADKVKEKLDGSSIESVVVRVQK